MILCVFVNIKPTDALVTSNVSYSIDWNEQAQRLPFKNYGMAAGFWDDEIYIFGGFNPITSVYSSTIYSIPLDDIQSSTTHNQLLWSNLGAWGTDSAYGSISRIYCSHCYTQIFNLVYIIGAMDTSAVTMIIYDMSTQTQINGASYDYTLPTRVNEPCVVNNGTHIFSIGGSNYDIVQIYDTINNVWFSGNTMYQARHWAQCVYDDTNKMIYVFGGQDSGGTTLNSIDMYHIAADTWYLSNHNLQIARSIWW